MILIVNRVVSLAVSVLLIIVIHRYLSPQVHHEVKENGLSDTTSVEVHSPRSPPGIIQIRNEGEDGILAKVSYTMDDYFETRNSKVCPGTSKLFFIPHTATQIVLKIEDLSFYAAKLPPSLSKMITHRNILFKSGFLSPPRKCYKVVGLHHHMSAIELTSCPYA